MSTSVINEYNPDVVFHPGETLREKLEELNVKPMEFAIRTGKPEKTISNVLNGKSSITPDMAVLFESVLKIPASFWLRKQSRYDEYRAREVRELSIKEAYDWARKFPYPQMVKHGWVKETRRVEEKVAALFYYFNIAVIKGWEDYFFNKKLSATFRISLTGTKNPYSISAWLRHGEIEAAKTKVNTFNKDNFQERISQLRGIMQNCNDNFLDELKRCCSDIGIKLVFTPSLPNAPINGVSRWIDGSPIIQLSNRWRRYDIFWFSFFHELGHILKHPTKFVSLENVEYEEKDESKEIEADRFAVQCVFSVSEEKAFLTECHKITRSNIVQFAKKSNTHPSIILGRLVHKGIVTPQSAGLMKLFKKLEM